MSLPSIVAAASDYSPDTVKARARAALLLAITRTHDRLADDANELTLNELSQATNSLGRIAGLADDERDGVVTIRVVRDDVPPHGDAPPRLLAEVADAQVVDATAVASLRGGVEGGGVPSGFVE